MKFVEKFRRNIAEFLLTLTELKSAAMTSSGIW